MKSGWFLLLKRMSSQPTKNATGKTSKLADRQLAANRVKFGGYICLSLELLPPYPTWNVISHVGNTCSDLERGHLPAKGKRRPEKQHYGGKDSG